MKLENSALYAQFNGMVLCGSHSGMTAQATGKCLDGHKLEKVTDAWIKREGDNLDWRCERCGIDQHGAKQEAAR